MRSAHHFSLWKSAASPPAELIKRHTRPIYDQTTDTVSIHFPDTLTKQMRDSVTLAKNITKSSLEANTSCIVLTPDEYNKTMRNANAFNELLGKSYLSNSPHRR